MSSVYDFEDDVLQSRETVNSGLGKVYYYRIKACRECNFKVVILQVMLPKVSMLTVIFAKNSCIIIREFKGASPFNSKLKKTNSTNIAHQQGTHSDPGLLSPLSTNQGSAI